MIISFGILIVSVLGSGTYALYRGVLSGNLGMNTNTHGLDYYINYVKGNDITSATLTPSSSYEGGVSSDIEFWKKDDSYDIYGKIKLTINNIGTNLSNSPALKYAVVHDGTVLSTGSLQGKASGTEITILSNLYLEDTKQIYNVYVWLDDSVEPGDISNEPLSISVDCTASLERETLITETIKDLYMSGKEETITDGSNVEYQLAPSVSLMNDRLGGTTTDLDGGNIRYYGGTPNNYIYFNCSTYPNSGCELWRIIGVFDGKLKIMRNTSIGDLAWDQDKNIDSSKTTYDNTWDTSSLKVFLNEKYYYGDTSGVITYYSGYDGSTSISMNLGSIGIKNNNTRSMIASENWYLGNHDEFDDRSVIYKSERTGTPSGENNLIWNGRIGLPYQSDYVYAEDLTLFGNYIPYGLKQAGTQIGYDGSTNWFYRLGVAWQITPIITYDLPMAWYEQASYNTAYNAGSVFPTLYLEPYVSVVGGSGTASDPYKIMF